MFKLLYLQRLVIKVPANRNTQPLAVICAKNKQMNKYSKYFIISICFLNINCSFGQNKEQCLEQLEENTIYIENLLNNSDSEPTDLKELRANFLTNSSIYEVTEKLNSNIFSRDTDLPEIYYEYPNTLINFRYSRMEMDQTLGDGYSFTNDFEENIDPAIFTIKKINYLDGTSADGKNLIISTEKSDQFGNQDIFIKGTKIIKNFDYQIEQNINKERIYELHNPGQTIVTPAGIIELVQNRNGYVKLKAAEKLQNIIRIIAKDDSEKFLKIFMSGEGGAYNKKYLLNYKKNIDDAILKLKEDKISCKTVKENYSYEKIQKDLEKQERSLFLTAYFTKEFEKAYLVIWDKTQNEKKIYTRNSSKYLQHEDGVRLQNIQEKFGYAVAKDEKTQLFGIISLQGSWIILPTFSQLKIDWQTKDMFYGALPNDESTTKYKLNRTSKTIVKIQK